MLKTEQKEAVSYLLEGKDVLAVLPTGFGKSLMYQSLGLAKEINERSVCCSSGRPSFLVIVRPRASSKSRSTRTSSILKSKASLSLSTISWRT